MVLLLNGTHESNAYAIVIAEHLMNLTRTYTETLRLTRKGHERLNEVLRDQCRLYNAALEHRRWAWKMAGDTVTLAAQSRELTAVRGDDPEAAAVHRTIQIGTLRRLDRAYQAFFRRVKAGDKPGFPRFKSSRRFRTLVCDNNVQVRHMVKIDDRGKGWIRVKGLCPMGFRAHRELPPISDLVELRICRTPRRVVAHLVFTSNVEVPVPTEAPERPVGIDLGVRSQVAFSDGQVVPGRREDRRRVRRLQRRVSRANRGSHSRRKKVATLAKEKQRQAEARKGWSHELSANIVSRYDFIALEDLTVKNMVRSAKGTVEEPGRNVRAKAGLNRSIHEQAWGDLAGKLGYKAESAGVPLVQVDPRNTSQECSGCGVLVPKALSVRTHQCSHCGLTLDRDVNAARNVLRRGLMVHAAGGKPAGAQVARESTETIGAGLRRIPLRRIPGADARAGPVSA